MLEVRIYENDKMIWSRNENGKVCACLNVYRDSTFEKFKPILQNTICHVERELIQHYVLELIQGYVTDRVINSASITI